MLCNALLQCPEMLLVRERALCLKGHVGQVRAISCSRGVRTAVRAGSLLFYDGRMPRRHRLVLLSRRLTGYVSFDLLTTLRTGRAHGKFEVFTSALFLGMGIAVPNRLKFACG